MSRCTVWSSGPPATSAPTLVPRLLDDGHAVRCLVRDPAKLARQPWAGRVEARARRHGRPVVRRRGVRRRRRRVLPRARHGRPGLRRTRPPRRGHPRRGRLRRRAASSTSAASNRTGPRNSAHLASRREVGEILLAGRAPTAVLQAGIVIGAGSASFRMIRNLAVSGPVLMLPDRAWNHTQPIGIDDVLHHLTACLALPPEVNATFDVGGPDVLTFGELVAGCAVAAGLPRPVLVPVPVSAPRLTARALGRRPARRPASRGTAAGVDGARARLPGGAARRPAAGRAHALRGGGAPGPPDAPTRRSSASTSRTWPRPPPCCGT